MSGAAPRVACIVLTWNAKATVLECVASVSRLTYPNLDLVVVDNASTDGTADAVTRAFPSATVLANDRNLMWSGGNNVGIEYVLSRGADYVLLLNNDVVVHPDLVTELVRAGESDPRIGVLGPKIYYHEPSQPDGGRRIWYAGGQILLWRGLARHVGIRETDRGQYDVPGPTGYVTGCALMVKREVFEQIGLIDTSFTAYGEDMDFSYRACRAGYELRYVPSAVLWHKVSASFGLLSRRKITQKARSHATFFWRHSPRVAWFTTIPLFQLLDGMRILVAVAAGRIRPSS